MRRSIRWDRVVVRKWFGIESDIEFQQQFARTVREARAKEHRPKAWRHGLGASVRMRSSAALVGIRDALDMSTPSWAIFAPSIEKQRKPTISKPV